MDQPTGGASEEFIRVCKLLADKLDRFDSTKQGDTSNTQIIKVDAGGWGILIALVMVAFLAGLNIAMSARQVTMAGDVNEIRRKQDRDDDYINSMFRILPELKQRFDHEKEQEQHEHPDHH